jgi:hypothetical protein
VLPSPTVTDGPASPAIAAARPAPAPGLGVAIIAAAGAVLAVTVAPFGTRTALWGPGLGQGLFMGAIPLALVATILAVRALRGGRRLAALTVIVVAVAAAAAPARVWLAARGAPPIHDVTTDLDNPPRYVAVARLRTAGSNPVAYAGEAVARQQRASYGDVRPLIVMAPPRRTLALAADTARAEGWTVLAEDIGFGDLGRLEASDRTFWFGRVDDVVVRVMPHQAGSRVDVRSSSRDDAIDGGRNAERIRRFLAFLAERARSEPPAVP